MKNNAIRRFGNFLFHLIYISILFLLAYSISSVVFFLIGGLPHIVEFLISALLGFCFVVMPIAFMEHKSENAQNGLYSELYNALDKISKGDFNVFISSTNIKKQQALSEIATKINNMAKELNSMEIMRQDFISNVSHEIQSPLTSIKGFSVLLKNKNLIHEEQISYIETIEMESQRLSKLGDNLLKLSALDSGATELQIKPYALDNQIKNIILAMEPQWANKNISFNIDIPSVTIYADEDLLHQVWINLLSNSIKFSYYNEEISVSIMDIKQTINVTIKDRGIGMSEESQRRIFERFYMADKARKRDLAGNGLGLSIVKKIVEMHGGLISVESQINVGSTFTVLIPKNNL